MDKVKCLKEIYKQLGGTESILPTNDTVCEILHKIAALLPNVVGGSGEIKTETLTTEINSDKFESLCNVVATSTGKIHQINVNFNCTAKVQANLLGKVATITLPEELRNLQTQYETMYCSIGIDGNSAYHIGSVGLTHSIGEETADINILNSDLSVVANAQIIFGCQFIFIA